MVPLGIGLLPVKVYNMIMRWSKVILIAILVLFFAGCSKSAHLSSFCKTDYTPFVLIDNPSARDISYAELLTFLDTFKPEVLPSKTCGHYAEELYNYSESQGIRCALVLANGHAFNGFLTDNVMTYVDIGKGIVSIAIRDNDGLKFVKKHGASIQTQKVGEENDFSIFWEGEK